MYKDMWTKTFKEEIISPTKNQPYPPTPFSPKKGSSGVWEPCLPSCCPSPRTCLDCPRGGGERNSPISWGFYFYRNLLYRQSASIKFDESTILAVEKPKVAILGSEKLGGGSYFGCGDKRCTLFWLRKHPGCAVLAAEEIPAGMGTRTP